MNTFWSHLYIHTEKIELWLPYGQLSKKTIHTLVTKMYIYYFFFFLKKTVGKKSLNKRSFENVKYFSKRARRSFESLEYLSIKYFVYKTRHSFLPCIFLRVIFFSTGVSWFFRIRVCAWRIKACCVYLKWQIIYITPIDSLKFKRRKFGCFLNSPQLFSCFELLWFKNDLKNKDDLKISGVDLGSRKLPGTIWKFWYNFVREMYRLHRLYSVCSLLVLSLD